MLMHNNPSMTSEAGELAARLAAIVASSEDAIVSKSRHFVELHGGTIGARSAGAGKGTEVWVELPRQMSVAAEAS